MLLSTHPYLNHYNAHHQRTSSESSTNLNKNPLSMTLTLD